MWAGCAGDWMLDELGNGSDGGRVGGGARFLGYN